MSTRRPLCAIGADLGEVPTGDGLPNLPVPTQQIVPVVGGTYALDGTAHVAILEPVLALGSMTLTLPTAPVEGQVQRVVTRYTITTLTVTAGTGKSIVGAPTTITPTAPFALVYRAASSTWFRLN